MGKPGPGRGLARPGTDRWQATDPEAPNPARMYDYLLGGKNNYPADRAAADSIREALPEAGAAAWANRGFHQRAAIWMARQGIGQFIDLGCGLPTSASTRAAVQKKNPSARVLYVDHDPIVAAHAHALLTGTGSTSVLLADVRDPAALLAAVHLDGLVDLATRTGLLCTAVLEHVADDSDPWGCVARLVSALAPGSYLALSHLTGDQMPPAGMVAITAAYRDATSQIYPRSLPEVTKFFDGLDVVLPYEGADAELCKVGLWGAEDPVQADDDSSRWRWAGVARRLSATARPGS